MVTIRNLPDPLVAIRGAVRRLLRNPMTEHAAALAASQYAAALIGAGSTIVVARLLGPTDYGLIALITAYPLLIGSVAKIKSGSVLTRYLSMFKGAGDQNQMRSTCKLGYLLDFSASSIACVLVAASSPWAVPHLVRLPGAIPLVVIFAAVFPLWSLLGTSMAVFTALQRFRVLAMFQILQRALPSLLVLVALLAHQGVGGAVVGMAMGNAAVGIAGLVSATYTLQRIGAGLWWRGSLADVVHLRRELTGFLGWNFLKETWGGVVTLVPVLLLGRFRGYEEAGFYRLSTSVVMASTYLDSSLGRVAYPILSSQWAMVDTAGIRNALRRWTTDLGIPVATTILLLIPLLPILVPLAFGPTYRSMVSGAQILMVGGVLPAALFWLDPFYYAAGRLGVWTVTYILITTVVLILAWFLVGQWGFPGLALLIAGGQWAFTLSLAVVATRSLTPLHVVERG